jgi:segregation and condensation protein B
VTDELNAFGRAVVPDWVGEAEPDDLVGALEAVCFALNRPLTVSEAAEIIGTSAARVKRAADLLGEALGGRGLMLQRHNDELQLVTHAQVSWAVQRALNPEKPSRLSQASLETLAIVAYRQPATRATVEFIRGVNCEAVLETLERRGLIEEVGRQDTPGQPRLFGTTLRFLQLVGLESIADLPVLEEGNDLPDFNQAAWNEVEVEAEPEVEVESTATS